MDTLIQWQRYAFFTGAAAFLITSIAGLNIPESSQVFLLAGLVILTGLPHGALDPLVAYNARIWNGWQGLATFLALYMLLATAALCIWLIAPGAALFSFLLYSGYHFSSDWKEGLKPFPRIASGFFIVSAPALFHPEIVNHYFGILAGNSSAGWIVQAMQVIALPATLGLIVAICLPKGRPSAKTELALLFAGAWLLPPLLFFVLYFCGLHSPRHLIHAAAGQPLTRVMLVASLFALLAVLMGTLAMSLSESPSLNEDLLRTVFIGLSVLTVPHMLLVEYATQTDS